MIPSDERLREIEAENNDPRAGRLDEETCAELIAAVRELKQQVADYGLLNRAFANQCVVYIEAGNRWLVIMRDFDGKTREQFKWDGQSPMPSDLRAALKKACGET